jgi:hypothetical protein
MNKRQFQDLLDRSDSSLMRAAEDLGVAESTVSRWKDAVPGYAEWYAHARALLTPAQRLEIDRRFRRKPRRSRQLELAW